ncbi:MAG: hypothetical protein Q8P41_13635 [Pseudomonadota bacterium]|nr:hypothetical protein [Pseudomonadota bacterium]
MDTPEATFNPLEGDAESALAPKIEEIRQNLAKMNERALAFARERPVTCVVGALALGFVVGKIAARY